MCMRRQTVHVEWVFNSYLQAREGIFFLPPMQFGLFFRQAGKQIFQFAELEFFSAFFLIFFYRFYSLFTQDFIYIFGSHYQLYNLGFNPFHNSP